VPHCGAYFRDRVAYTRRIIDFFDRAAAADERPAVAHVPVMVDGLSEAGQAAGG
jgi:hypothetical protein